ncbi:hypothetical protein U1Q18_037749, partial [Sarracenia purpurea var. burkii]
MQGEIQSGDTKIDAKKQMARGKSKTLPGEEELTSVTNKENEVILEEGGMPIDDGKRRCETMMPRTTEMTGRWTCNDDGDGERGWRRTRAKIPR